MEFAKHQRVRARIKRITGQVGGVQRMIDDDRYWLRVSREKWAT